VFHGSGTPAIDEVFLSLAVGAVTSSVTVSDDVKAWFAAGSMNH
jgi:hypothetical protein